MADVRAQIIQTLSQVQDPALKSMLLLMHQMQEETRSAIEALGNKMDKVLADEERIKAMVLNGHAGDFDDLLDWVRLKIKEEADAAASKRSIRDDWVKNILWLLTMFVGGALASKLAIPFLN